MLRVVIWHDQKFVIEFFSGCVNLTHRRTLLECCNHAPTHYQCCKNGAGEFLPMCAQSKHISFAHPRECKSSTSSVEKMIHVAYYALQLIFLRKYNIRSILLIMVEFCSF